MSSSSSLRPDSTSLPPITPTKRKDRRAKSRSSASDTASDDELSSAANASPSRAYSRGSLATSHSTLGGSGNFAASANTAVEGSYQSKRVKSRTSGKNVTMLKRSAAEKSLLDMKDISKDALEDIREAAMKPFNMRELKDVTMLMRVATNVKFFKDFSLETVREICKVLEHTVVKEEQDVFRVGSVGDRFYIILQGIVDVIITADGEERSVALLRSGDSFGEVAMITDAARTATVRATVDTEFLTLRKPDYQRVIMKIQMEELSRNARWLRELFPVLRQSGQRELVLLARLFTVKTFSAGEQIVKQGEPLENLYFVLGGKCSRSMCMQFRRENEVASDALVSVKGNRPERRIDLGSLIKGDCIGSPEIYHKSWKKHVADITVQSELKVAQIEAHSWRKQVAPFVKQSYFSYAIRGAQKLHDAVKAALIAEAGHGLRPAAAVRIPILVQSEPEDLPNDTLDVGLILRQAAVQKSLKIRTETPKTPKEAYFPTNESLTRSHQITASVLGVKQKVNIPLTPAVADTKMTAFKFKLPRLGSRLTRKLAKEAQSNAELFYASSENESDGKKNKKNKNKKNKNKEGPWRSPFEARKNGQLSVRRTAHMMFSPTAELLRE